MLSAALILGLALSVSAVEIPDASRKGSLTLTMVWDGKSLDGGRLTLYRVGTIDNHNGDYFFVPVPQLEDAAPQLTDLTDKTLPPKFLALAEEKQLTPIHVPILSGKALAESLSTGLYLVAQAEEDACDGYDPIDPFLISLPQWDGKTYQYDITARPKVGLPDSEPTEPTEPEPSEPEPSEPEPSEPEKPGPEKEPRLPQTGQQNWPVPVMAVSGLMLILLGRLLCTGKKEGHEK